jgi:glutamate--cysteine ligase
MRRLTESAAERLIAEHSFECGPPGFVGAAIDLPGPAAADAEDPFAGRGINPAGPISEPLAAGGPGSLEGGGSPAGEVRRALRHGFAAVRADGSVTVSGPPSPGLESCVARMSDDLATMPAIGVGGDAAVGVRVGLEAGLDGGGPLGLARRWRLAHTLAPVLAAAFANTPSAHDRPGGWRSVRAARHRDRPVLPGTPAGDPAETSPAPTDPARTNPTPVSPAAISPCMADLGAVDPRWTGAEPYGIDCRTSWVTYAMAEPVPWLAGRPDNGDPALGAAGKGRSFREWTRSGEPPTQDDLLRHLDGLRPPVAARGHLELDFADGQAGDGWRVVVAVVAVLLDDPVAATAAEAATGEFAYGERVWERAARDALTDEELATAARHCFLAAYAALARRGAPRDLRDAVAAFMERYVMRGRCPADDRLAAGRHRVIGTS